jgi:hypothetical protein
MQISIRLKNNKDCTKFQHLSFVTKYSVTIILLVGFYIEPFLELSELTSYIATLSY